MLNKIANINCFKLSYQWSFLLVKRIFKLLYLLLPLPYTFHITFSICSQYMTDPLGHAHNSICWVTSLRDCNKSIISHNYTRYFDTLNKFSDSVVCSALSVVLNSWLISPHWHKYTDERWMIEDNLQPVLRKNPNRKLNPNSYSLC